MTARPLETPGFPNDFLTSRLTQAVAIRATPISVSAKPTA
jgi:hypothetical protein